MILSIALRIAIFYSLFFTQSAVYGQPPIGRQLQFDTKIFYDVSFKTDSNSTEVFNEITELLVNDSLSLFRSVNHGKQDSALNSAWKQDGRLHLSMQELLKAPSKLKFRVIKTNDSIFLFEDFNNPNTPHETSWYSEKQNMEWMLSDETRDIEGLTCQKAVIHLGGREWHAWFTAAIPISEGPYKFGGLPGLIVAIQDLTGTWKMNLVSIFPNENSTVDFFNIPKNQLNALNQKQFQSLKRYYRDNYFNLLLADGSFDGVKAETIRQQEKYYKNRALKENNWIELVP